jgi:4-amino-4-deoxy-L-arabinose transferase-like glycosyltransferase
VRTSVRALVATWVAVLVVAAALLAATGYRTRDPDSRAYITITTHLVDEPVSRWIAPQWWGAFGLQGLFREHPAGTFAVPALLARAGYPVGQSLFVVTLACQIISLLLMSALAARLAPASHARALVWGLQLIPIAFVFRVRANQEYPLLAGLLVTVYALERARASWGWIALALVGAFYAVLVKGVFALLAPVLAGLWLLSRRPQLKGDRVARVALGVTALLMPLLALGYERAYVAVTGQSFLEYYLGARIALEGSTTTSWPFPFDKVVNASWYAGRVLWYAAPWSLVPIVIRLPAFRGRFTSASRDWARFAGMAALVTIGLVAARDTKADRYVFPAYFFAASAGIVLTCACWPRAAAWASRLDRTWPWGPAVLWLVLVAGRILIV